MEDPQFALEEVVTRLIDLPRLAFGDHRSDRAAYHPILTEALTKANTLVWEHFSDDIHTDYLSRYSAAVHARDTEAADKIAREWIHEMRMY
ncbi:MAG: hypothetical protein ABIH41_06615 [Nanoarchaeota archaeon]